VNGELSSRLCVTSVASLLDCLKKMSAVFVDGYGKWVGVTGLFTIRMHTLQCHVPTSKYVPRGRHKSVA
jgi:hypothetical protein